MSEDQSAENQRALVEESLPDEVESPAVPEEESVEGTEASEVEGLESDSEVLDERESLVPEINALLFSSSKPLSLKKLSKCTKADEEQVSNALDEIFLMFSAEVHGFSLAEVSGRYQFRTPPELSETLKRLHPPKLRRISQAAAETLSVIAYKQPVQKGEIESIRGVDALPTIKTLLDAKLVRIVGSEDVAGTPALYGTTDLFLERFGLSDLSDLPSIADLEAIELEPGEVMEAPESGPDSDDQNASSEGVSAEALDSVEPEVEVALHSS